MYIRYLGETGLSHMFLVMPGVASKMRFPKKGDQSVSDWDSRHTSHQQWIFHKETYVCQPR
jgi:hypothetical protein